MNSRDVSPIEVLDAHRDRTDSLSSSNQPSPSHIGGFNLSIPDYDFGGTSSGYSNYQMSSDDNELKAFDSKQVKSHWQGKKTLGSRKSKHVPEIESLLEGVPLESNFNKKQIPYPLNLQKVRIPLKAPRKHFLKLFFRISANLMALKDLAVTRHAQQPRKLRKKSTRRPFRTAHRKLWSSSQKTTFPTTRNRR